MRVTLVRHTSVDVERGTCYGWSDVDVSTTFEQEAEQTRRQLSAMVFDRVYCSPLTRARRLAAYCGYGDAVTDERLREMNMGRWEMLRYDDIADPYLHRWYADYLNLPTPGGESYRMLYARVAAFLDELRLTRRADGQPLTHVAIFAHGGVLLSAGVYAGIYDESTMFSHLTPYGGVVTLDI